MVSRYFRRGFRGIQRLKTGASTRLRRITRDQCWIKLKTTESFNLTELEKVTREIISVSFRRKNLKILVETVHTVPGVCTNLTWSVVYYALLYW